MQDKQVDLLIVEAGLAALDRAMEALREQRHALILERVEIIKALDAPAETPAPVSDVPAPVANANCPTGTALITGEVIATAVKEYDGKPVLKITVKDDRGFRVWGTAPKVQGGVVDKGHRVRFAATVEPSQDDAEFGFFKYPKNGEVL